jgi:hypothetical protein
MADQAFSGVSKILALADDDASGVKRTDDAVFVNHKSVASLSEPQASGLGLPPGIPFPLQIDTHNLITDTDFRLSGYWVDELNRPIRSERNGALVRIDDLPYRIPEPLFSLIEAIDAFQKADTSDDNVRMSALAILQSIISTEGQDQVSLDAYLSKFRVVNASAFSLSLRVDRNSFDFDPILFGHRTVERSQAEGCPISEAESLLTEYQQDIFSKERFRAAKTVKPSYVVESGVYVYLDPALREALSVVRQLQDSDPEIKRRFAQNPQLFLKEALSDKFSDSEAERLFVETEQYSSRIINVGIWAPPVLPWIKREPNDWLPEKFGLQIGNQYVVLERDEIGPLREKIIEARSKGEAAVEFGKERISIPANVETEQSLSTLLGFVKPDLPPPKPPPSKELTQTEGDQKRVLIVEENFETLGFTRKQTPRLKIESSVPAAVKPRLKKHQTAGLSWLQENWREGTPGVLLADDMGLGKTLQALAFLAWICEKAAYFTSYPNLRGPILIVAPTGLLANWEKEHEFHLHTPGLGEICRAYGRHLKTLKITNNGVPALDRRRIQQANWVLTTYETLRDYHLDFAAIRFSCAVFDEMQKVKSPTSLLTRAAKTLNADFTVGLTGTPIENQLSDIWCILDIVSPGLLGDLKTFSQKYRPGDKDALTALHSMLMSSQTSAPPPMLRRMKADELDGLPEKKIHIRKRFMPEFQARIYADTVIKAKQPDAGPMLETLHLLRGTSLHPVYPPAGAISDPASFIGQSARLIETFAILDEIAARDEKVLIFLESLDLQEHLALMIKRRYDLKHRPMQINGEISGEKRQRIVDEFQSKNRGFDVLILSPRAGGVGLTLTAANNVIHLSRWWNPAVEDQCTDRIYRIGQNQTVNVYYPMAIHPHYKESSFDELLNTLLLRKRQLSTQMLMPPVNLKMDQSWFADNLGRESPNFIFDEIDLDELDSMEPTAFESWALNRCIQVGWEAFRTPGSYDGGADGILMHRATGAKVIVQCKHTQSVVKACGADAVDDLLRARECYCGNASRLIALSNAERFSQAALDRAQRFGIDLIARQDLSNWPRQLMS